MATRAIGVDIGTTQVRVAELELSGKGPGGGGRASLVNFASAPLPAGVVGDGEVLDAGALAAVLKNLWAGAKFSEKKVIVGFGNQRTVLRELDLPAMTMKDLRSSLPFQVSDLLPMPVDDALLDFYPTAEVEEDGVKQLRGILVAANKNAVANTVAAIEAAGLQPVAVDLTSLALIRALVFGEWAQQVVALVDVGARTTEVVVVQNGMPRFIRVIPSGGAEATDAVMSAMKVSATDAEGIKRATGMGNEVAPELQPAKDAIGNSTRTLVDGIRNTFVYYAGNNPGAPIQRILITGGGSHLAGFGQYLASACRLPVSFGDGFSRVAVGGKLAQTVNGQQTLAAVAVGLGMMEVES
ncbi:type IV pilus assembly protein PilM [Demequina capsici]|uniref:Type IV pilus assembly protein PilM n=1 Tax=Demequina capsici TaxID=3075620 RepID=A0AA96FFV1_9MICO|nr:type IV pilus assembly protein PilM [Demequina sp. PMTSA13]WNM28672.1 type IV pilus assembly protein PilM [Demequina sp. PMTSA13]